MKPIDRRSFLKNSLLGAAAVSLPGHQPLAAQTAARNAAVEDQHGRGYFAT